MAQPDLKGVTVVFDLDGTLVDTAPDLTDALNHALTSRGHAAVSADSIRSKVGYGARVMIEEALRRAGARDDVDRMLAAFLVHYESHIAELSRPFPGAVRALDALADAGARLAICTNKRERLTLELLQALKLDTRFDAIAGRDTFVVSKPDPGHLLGVIERAGGSPWSTVMVGDSEVDILTAKRAAVKAIGVSFGYAQASLAEFNPDAIIDHFDELLPTTRGLVLSAGLPAAGA